MLPELTFTAYTDLALARLYELEQKTGLTGTGIDVAKLMKDLAGDVPPGWPWDAATHIVEQGFGHDFRAQGSPQTALTPSGRIYVERAHGVIADYRSSPQIVLVTGNGNQVAIGHGQHVAQDSHVYGLAMADILDLLDELDERIRHDPTLADQARAEALADVDVIRNQAGRENPSLAVITAVLTSLASIDGIADLVGKLQGAFT